MRGWYHLWFEAHTKKSGSFVSAPGIFYKPPCFPWAWYLISKHPVEHICSHGRNLNAKLSMVFLDFTTRETRKLVDQSQIHSLHISKLKHHDVPVVQPMGYKPCPERPGTLAAIILFLFPRLLRFLGLQEKITTATITAAKLA